MPRPRLWLSPSPSPTPSISPSLHSSKVSGLAPLPRAESIEPFPDFDPGLWYAGHKREYKRDRQIEKLWWIGLEEYEYDVGAWVEGVGIRGDRVVAHLEREEERKGREMVERRKRKERRARERLERREGEREEKEREVMERERGGRKRKIILRAKRVDGKWKYF